MVADAPPFERSRLLAPPHVTRGFGDLGVCVEVREIAWPAKPSCADVSHPSPPRGHGERRRALVAECSSTWHSLSWASVGGGIGREQRYICAEVRNSDLPLGVEPRAVIERFLLELGCASGVVALTSANVAQYRAGFARQGDVCAAALVTAGMANALRVGEPCSGAPRRYLPDTINLACWVNLQLTFEAQLEALSIVTQARTLEVLEAKVPSLEQNGWATGTGTDCITLFSQGEPADADADACRYAGMHTAAGRVLGQATRDAVSAVVRAWQKQTNAKLSR